MWNQNYSIYIFIYFLQIRQPPFSSTGEFIHYILFSTKYVGKLNCPPTFLLTFATGSARTVFSFFLLLAMPCKRCPCVLRTKNTCREKEITSCLFGRPHLCIESSLKRLTGDRWRHLEIQYLPHLLMSKHIYLNPVITIWITMYPSDDALIGPAPCVTALEASIQPSEPIREQQSKAVDTAATAAGLERI